MATRSSFCLCLCLGLVLLHGAAAGSGNALLCENATSPASCWGAEASRLRAPVIALQSSAAAKAFAAGASTSKVAMVPNFADLWAARPRAKAPLPHSEADHPTWDTSCDAALGCYEYELEQPQMYPDIARSSALSAVMWVQGRALHSGDLYVTMLNGTVREPPAHPSGVSVSVVRLHLLLLRNVWQIAPAHIVTSPPPLPSAAGVRWRAPGADADGGAGRRTDQPDAFHGGLRQAALRRQTPPGTYEDLLVLFLSNLV